MCMWPSDTLLKSQNTAIMVVTDALAIDYLNPAAEALLKTSNVRASGREVMELLGPQSGLAPVLDKAVTDGETYTLREMTLSVPSEGETMLVDCTISPLIHDGTCGLLLELWRVDNLVKLARDSWRAERQQATREMIRGLAHEIKNPLGGLRGAAQLLERELPSEELAEFTTIITQEADRLSNLVDRMTAPYREVSQEWLNPHEILEHVYKLVLAEAGDRLKVERDYDPSLPDIYGERDGLTQVILNIVRNAAQAISGTGRIVIRTRIGRRQSIGGRVFRQAIRIEICDDGPGVSSDLVDKLFFPMVTGRADGTGLGLSIAQEIVSRHQGTIEFTSQPGETCFLVLLPVIGPDSTSIDTTS